jgi:hypothetical protein
MFYGESHPYQVSLSDVRVIMIIICVLVVELLCQVVMGRISALECLLPDAHAHLWLHLVMSGIEWPRYSRILVLGSLARYW